MSFVRINMVEFDTEKDLKLRQQFLTEKTRELFPEAELIAGVRTGEKSMMTFSVYPTEEMADEAKIARDSMLRSAPGQLNDILSLEGDLTLFNMKLPSAVKL